MGLSFDSSGSYLGAVDSNGDAAVFELRYHHAVSGGGGGTDRAVSASAKAAATAPADPQEGGALASLWSWAGGGGALKPPSSAVSSRTRSAPVTVRSPPASTPAASAAAGKGGSAGAGTSPPLPAGGALAAFLPVPSRFYFSRDTHSSPTCLAVDPSYRRRRDKMVVTGFADGRVVLTKLGTFLKTRKDTSIYQGVMTSNRGGGRVKGGGLYAKGGGGIEAMEWRGSMLAWADAR